MWLPETWGPDAVTVLAAVAERTYAIGLGPSVLPVFSRSPALISQTAAHINHIKTSYFTFPFTMGGGVRETRSGYPSDLG